MIKDLEWLREEVRDLKDSHGNGDGHVTKRGEVFDSAFDKVLDLIEQAMEEEAHNQSDEVEKKNKYIINSVGGETIRVDGLSWDVNSSNMLRIKLYEDDKEVKYSAGFNWNHIVGIRRLKD